MSHPWFSPASRLLVFPGERMVKQKPLESPWQALLNVTLAPAVARLPTVRDERRDLAARHALLCRIHSEFAEMPGLSLTAPQAAKLFGLSPEVVLRILERLIVARVLRRKGDGRFAMSGEET